MRRKLLLILLCCLGGLALVAGSTVWWASRHMRTPEFRAEFTRLMLEATGHEVSLEGDLEVSVFPWFGLSAKGFRLGNDLEFGPAPMLTAKSLSARIKVLPLFERKLVFDTVILDEADVALTLDAEGRGNWDRLLERIRAQENATDKDGAFFRKMTVRGVRLSASKARLDDLKHNHSFIMTDVDLRTGRIESGKPLPFTVACDFFWPRPGLTSRLEATGKLNWSGDANAPLLLETTAQGEIGGDFLPRHLPRAAVTAFLSMEDGNRHLQLSNLRLKVLGVEVSGSATFFDVTERFRMEAHLHLARFNPRSVLNAYWPQTLAPEQPGVLHAVEGPLKLSANEDELVFSSPGLALDAARLRGQVRLGFDDTPGLDVDLAADRLDLDAYAAAFLHNATSQPLLVEDLPLDYLRGVAGKGRLGVETLQIFGATAQGALLEWTAENGAHRLALRPAKAQGGILAAEISAVFAGVPAQPGQSGKPGGAVLGAAGSLRMEGVEARQVSWLARPGLGLNGRLDLRARADVSKTPAAGGAPLSQVLRRATGEVAASTTGQAILEWEEAKSQGKAQTRRMVFTALQAQARLGPAAAPEGAWAMQADGSLAAVGTKPMLNLDARFSGVLRPGQRGGLQLAGTQTSGRLKGWFLPRRENEATFAGKGDLDFSAQTLALSSLAVNSCGLSLSGALKGTQVLGSGFSLSGRLRCQEGDPKRVLAALDVRPFKPADRRALTRLTGEADMSLTAKGVSLADINAQVDDTRVRGSYTVQGFASPRQSFNLQAGALDLDRYLPAKETPVRRWGQPEPRPAPEPLPVDEVRDLMLDGSLQLREFKLYGLTTRQLKAVVQAQGGLLTVKPLAGSFYGGDISGEIAVQAVQKNMQVRLALAAKGFQAGGFMLGWAGKEYVSGRADLFLDVEGAGATDTEVLRTLEGLAGFKITDGSYALSGAAEPAPQKRPPSASGQAGGGQGRRSGTAFAQASAKLKVQNGVFQNNDFRLEGPNIIVTGRGSFSLADDSISVSLAANMPGMPEVPIKVFGRLKDPEMEIPPGMLINNALKEILGFPLKPIKFFRDLLF